MTPFKSLSGICQGSASDKFKLVDKKKKKKEKEFTGQNNQTLEMIGIKLSSSRIGWIQGL